MYQPCVRRATAALAKDGAAALGTRHCPTSRRKANAAPAQHRIVVRHDRERQRSYECRARRGGCGCYDASAAPRKFADRDGSNSGIGSVVDLCHLEGPRGPIAVVIDGPSPSAGSSDALSMARAIWAGHLRSASAFTLSTVNGMFSFSWEGCQRPFTGSTPRSEGTRSEMDRWPVLRGLGGCRTRGAELNPVRPTP